MYIYFGIVKKYLPEKGFGFLTHPISLGPNKDIFFHITNVKRSQEDIAERLLIYDSTDKICFWYTSETTRKGEQLQSILKPQDVFNLHQDNPNDFKEKIECVWKNIEEPVPFWLSEVTMGLFGSSGNDELKSEREILIQKRDKEREIQRKEQERLRKIKEEVKIEQEIQRKEQERLRKIEEEKAKIEREIREKERRIQEEARAKVRNEAEEERKQQEEIEKEEFELLVTEMNSKDFTTSGQVSNYIIRNRLGNKYQNISGVLEMENSTSSWKFNGGFSPRIYAKLCERLNLGNKGTKSSVTGFTSFKNLK